MATSYSAGFLQKFWFLQVFWNIFYVCEILLNTAFSFVIWVWILRERAHKTFVFPHFNTYFVTRNHRRRVRNWNGTSYIRGFTSFMAACHGMLSLNIVFVNEKTSSMSSKQSDTKWSCVNSMFVRCFRELIAPIKYSIITSFPLHPTIDIVPSLWQTIREKLSVQVSWVMKMES